MPTQLIMQSLSKAIIQTITFLLLSGDFHVSIKDKTDISARVISKIYYKYYPEATVSSGSHLTKLSDANNAGTRLSSQCTLILTEGDSAKGLAVAGLGVVGRDNFGVFPLRGKLLNVREAKHDTIMKNEEIQNVKKILGLQHNKVYSDISSLRYGKLCLMTDQVFSFLKYQKLATNIVI